MTTTGHPGSAAAVDLAPTFPVLDTVRAIGALAVLTTHTTFQSGTYLDHGVWGTFMARLDVGVAIFFVLSGFLLARPHFARASRGIAPPDLGRYALKRVLRIYPAYLVTVVLALTLVPRNAGTSIRDWIATLLLIDPYVRKQLPHGLTHMWSLSAEVAFYALLPLLMVGALGRHRALRPARVTALVLAMVLIAISWHLWLAMEVDVRWPDCGSLATSPGSQSGSGSPWNMCAGRKGDRPRSGGCWPLWVPCPAPAGSWSPDYCSSPRLRWPGRSCSRRVRPPKV